MRYLSPSALYTLEKSEREFYIRYIARDRPPRPPQASFMAAGAGFDARIKSFLRAELLGRVADGWSFEELFERQVEPHNRDVARKVGEWLFNGYVSSGAAANLLIDMSRADGEPLFESEIIVERDGVTLGGWRDLAYRTREALVTLDWKVNGTMSKATPVPGYLIIRGSGLSKSHPKAVMERRGGMVVSTGLGLPSHWRRQLGIYGLAAREGEIAIGCIEQLVCEGVERMRVATFRSVEGLNQEDWRLIHHAGEITYNQAWEDAARVESQGNDFERKCAQLAREL